MFKACISIFWLCLNFFFNRENVKVTFRGLALCNVIKVVVVVFSISKNIFANKMKKVACVNGSWAYVNR